MARWTPLRTVALAMAAAGAVALLPTAATATPTANGSTTPYCGITWGSQPKSLTSPAADPLVGVRAGRHDCYDRIVLDIAGGAPGYLIDYVPAVTAQATGEVVPLRGGAFLQINANIPAYDADGRPTYTPADPRELVNVNGYRTFRQVAWGGSFEAQTTVGLGVRARLPFRVLAFKNDTGGTRLIIDVAHQW